MKVKLIINLLGVILCAGTLHAEESKPIWLPQEACIRYDAAPTQYKNQNFHMFGILLDPVQRATSCTFSFEAALKYYAPGETFSGQCQGANVGRNTVKFPPDGDPQLGMIIVQGYAPIVKAVTDREAHICVAATLSCTDTLGEQKSFTLKPQDYVMQTSKSRKAVSFDRFLKRFNRNSGTFIRFTPTGGVITDPKSGNYCQE